MAIEVKLLEAGDEDVLTRVAPEVFDDPIDPRATAAFLADPRHRIAVALDEELVVGFVTAVVYVHPDKPQPELWINEVSVAPTHRRLTLGRALIDSILDAARAEGCSEAWVLTERDNEAAMRLYSGAGAHPAATDPVMFTFPLDRSGREPPP
jgi:ribosomal protein S18 acetylase RimI-like enzyme